jgi:hypothetical protein
MLAWLLKGLGRNALAVAVVLAVLMAGAWLAGGLAQLARDEAQLRAARGAIPAGEQALEAKAKALEGVRERRRQVADALYKAYLAQHAKVTRLEAEYRELWESHPVYRRLPMNEVHTDLMRRHGIRQAERAVLDAHLRAYRWAAGVAPGGASLRPEELARVRSAVPAFGPVMDEFERSAAELARLRADLDGAKASVAALEERLAASGFLWIRDELFESAARQFWTAVAIVTAALLTPFGIRAFFYYVLAPAAVRRPPFRIAEGDSGALVHRDGVKPAEGSAVSLEIVLEPGENLVALADYI